MMKKTIILLVTALTISVFGQYNQPENAWEYKDVNNGQFFKDPKIWKGYLKANLEYFEKLNNPVHNSCGEKEKPNLLNALSNEGYGNIKFFKIKNTDVFYSSEDKFLCDLNISILKHEFPTKRRRGLVAEGKEALDAFYWTTPSIAKRWYIAAQSLKRCGIRIKDYSLTTFESTGLAAFEIPSMQMGHPASYNIFNSFAKDEELQKPYSVKYIYTGDVIEGNITDRRGEYSYSTASSGFSKEKKSAMRSGWIKRDSMAVPIFPPGGDSDDPGYVDEIHELYHILTQKNYACHIKFKDHPNKYAPMTEMFMRSGGKFDPSECKEMREGGEASKLLTCYPERPFQPSPDNQ